MADIRKIYEDFNAEAYAKVYLGQDDYENQFLAEDFYHRLFTQGKLNGKTLLDVGCGPTMRSALSAGGHVSEIYLCDFVENNLKILKKWLKNEPDAVDYSKLLNHVAKLEGKTDTKYLEERVRKSTKDVFFCDILADNPLNPRPLQQFDILTSSYCVDSFPDYKDYLKSWKGLYSLLRPGGHLALLGTIDTTYYVVGEKKLPGANVNKASVEAAVTQAGFQILEFEEHRYKNDLNLESDCKGCFTLLAKKA
uniref:Methyltransferase domain-containing protein n=1 Tax=Strigamia maritima TaxID=126957 RepID=T1JAW6_STRMM